MKTVNELHESSVRVELECYRSYVKSRIERLNITINDLIEKIKDQKDVDSMVLASSWNEGLLFGYQQELSSLETIYEVYTIKNI